MSLSKSTMVLGYWDIRGVSAVPTTEPLGQRDGRGGDRGLRVSGLREEGAILRSPPTLATAQPVLAELPDREDRSRLASGIAWPRRGLRTARR